MLDWFLLESLDPRILDPSIHSDVGMIMDIIIPSHRMNSNNEKRIRVLRNKEAVAEFAVNTWIELATAAVAEKGLFTAALSGGRTPIDFYQQLASCPHPLPWDKTHIFFADERFVPSDDNASNYRMINEQLLSRIPIPKEKVHPILTEGVTLEGSAEKYETDIRTFFKIGDTDIPVFDLIMLGIGEDGHTASLFPGTAALQETKRLAIPVIADASPSERISLSLGVINNAKNICFLVTGKSKADAIKEIIEDKASALPAALVKPTQGTVLFVIDQAAASLLSGEGG
jgi:6-phosphogluconolactonase